MFVHILRLSASVSDCVCQHTLTLLRSLSFMSCLCQHNAGQSHWKMDLFSATLQLLVVSNL